jgi:hypothetical protein
LLGACVGFLFRCYSDPFYRHLDDRDSASLAALMLPDGVWHRQGAALTGEAATIAALGRRSPTMRIHHLLTNAFAVPTGPDTAEATAYMLVIRHEPGSPLDSPAPLAGIENIRTIRAALRHTAQDWRVAQLRRAIIKTEDTPCIG